MNRLLAAWLFAGVTGAFAETGTGADPMATTECVNARAELESALGQPAAVRKAHPERVARARRQAALACLGPDSSSRERAGAPEPAQVVPPPTISARPLPTPGAIAPQPPPLAPPRPAFITTCDPTGCWDSEGRRLNSMGPVLMGPRGPCIVQGGLLNCP